MDDVIQKYINEQIELRLSSAAIKAVGDWELDVLAVPFGGRDSDGQWFDAGTDIAHESFTTPLVTYHHGVMQGKKGLEPKPITIGKTVPGSLEKRQDGWHIRVILDKAVKYAQAIMDAARRMNVAVSSDSIAHLARLEVGGKSIQYEKNRPGRISVWPLAGVSLWEMDNGNHKPANMQAIALPAMKAMYRDAGLAFPDIDTTGVSPEARKLAAKRAEVIKTTKRLLGERS